MEILRRIGVPPRERGSHSNVNCPDLFELTDGRFAVIGRDVTRELGERLPADASRGDDESIVVITRDTLLRAKAHIPDA
ncbi:MAG: hypothetical protein V7603_4384 [Micromonosporaceae bacterium]